MILPSSDRRKILWNLADCLDDIDRTIEETNLVEFQRNLEALYPRLQEYGLALMINDPALYQGVWYEYHVTALKNLRRHIRAETFVVKDWNEICTRINEWLKKQSR